MASQMIVRIDPELKNKVAHLAKVEGKNVSLVIRELLQEYVKQRDMGGYVDDLWNRIGRQVRERGFSAGDIDTAIAAVRSAK